jgi:hypothetical protein
MITKRSTLAWRHHRRRGRQLQARTFLYGPHHHHRRRHQSAKMVDAGDDISGQKFNALRNAIYNVARRNFFDLLNRLLNCVVIILGAAVAGKAAKLWPGFDELYLEIAVLVFATAQLAFDFGYRARTHEILQSKYYEMLAEIELDPSPNARKYEAKLYTIAAGEPMPLRALDALAYNAALDATESDLEVIKANRLRVPALHRWLRHIVAFHAHQYTPASMHRSLLKRCMDLFSNKGTMENNVEPHSPAEVRS